MTTHPRNPFVFVVGCPRSGTTLLQRMLNNHPQLAVAYDTLFIPAVLRGGRNKNPAVTPELVRRIEQFRRFERFGLPAGSLQKLAPGAQDYVELVCRIYDAFAQFHGKSLAGEKSPGYVRHMPLLQELFPWAKFIHLVRDGRDVALSLMDWGRQKKRPKGPARKYRLWDESPLAVSALWWAHKAGRGRRDPVGTDPEACMEIRYETLVTDSEKVLRRVADFVELPFSSDMERFYVGKTVDRPGLSAKTAWLPATRGLRDWRVSMQADDVALFEALAGDCLRDFGYPLQYERIPSATRRRAERYRKLWLQEKGRSITQAVPEHSSQ